MASDDKRKKSINPNEGDSDERGTGTSGGQGGGIEFHDFIGTGDQVREDQLSPSELKRLLSVHQDIHEARVKKQKALREQRQAVKEGKIPLQVYRQGLAGTGMNAAYRANPILANKAQFSGIDRQVNALPTENIAETNQEKQEELQYQYQLRFAPENAPRFNPKPQFR
jgi:hypothetical protein